MRRNKVIEYPAKIIRKSKNLFLIRIYIKPKNLLQVLEEHKLHKNAKVDDKGIMQYDDNKRFLKWIYKGEKFE